MLDTTGMEDLQHPTPYPDVNAIVQQILSGAQSVLGDSFVGMYLTGSLATGDWDPQNSDIDFIIATTTALSTETFEALQVHHAHIAAGSTKWAIEIEGSYIPKEALRRYNPNDAWHPHIFRGTGPDESRLFMMHHASDWVIQRHILREQGVVVAGPPPQRLVEPIQPDELRDAVRDLATVWPVPLLHDPEPLRHDGYHAYLIVTLCRMLYTLEHGTVVSKPVAARWAQTSVQQGAELIERALAWSVHWDDLPATLDFMRYTLEHAQQRKLPS